MKEDLFYLENFRGLLETQLHDLNEAFRHVTIRNHNNVTLISLMADQISYTGTQIGIIDSKIRRMKRKLEEIEE